MRIKLASRKIIGTSRHLNFPSKRIIPTVGYLHVFLQNTYCCRGPTIPARLTLNGEPRDEMVSDLLKLASALRTESDLREVFQWMADCRQASDNTSESPKSLLNKAVGNAELACRQPPTPKDVNCLFHAMHDQLVRLERVSQSATKLRSDKVNYLRSNPVTRDGIYFSGFINLRAWNTYLRRMAMDGEGVTGLLYGA